MSKIICTKILPKVNDRIDIQSILDLIPANIKTYLYSNNNGCWLQTDALDDNLYNLCKATLGDLIYIPAEQLDYNFGTAIAPSGLNIREESNESCNVVGVLDQGQRFKIQGETGKWYHISEPVKGYVYKEYTQVSQTPSTVSEDLIKFTSSWEGFSATPYRDAGGNWTVGFGDCTYNEEPNSVTYQQALNMLTNTLNNLAARVHESFENDDLTQYQLDALVDFSYNLGFGALMGSDLVQNFRACNNNSIIEPDFTAWSYCDGRELEGLERRRVAEYQMFLFNQYNNN